MKRLLFVDTNVWLDFYRTRTDAGLSLLQHLDKIKTQIIVTYILEMEFKKHRHSVIAESMRNLEPPKGFSRPGLFSDAAAVKAINKNLDLAGKKLSTLKKRFIKMIEDPAGTDPVFKVCQRVFHKNDNLTLDLGSDLKGIIGRKAMRRFILGCPPRKQGDTSIGDAINWEWIVYCAEKLKSEVAIVSRDSDFGTPIDGKGYLNAHLKQGFSERVSKKRRIMFFNRLSDGLTALQIPVSKKEIKEEDSLIERSAVTVDSRLWTTLHQANLQKYLNEFITKGIVKTEKDSDE